MGRHAALAATILLCSSVGVDLESGGSDVQWTLHGGIKTGLDMWLDVGI